MRARTHGSTRAKVITGTVRSHPTHPGTTPCPGSCFLGARPGCVGPNGSSWKPVEPALQEGEASPLDNTPVPDRQLNAQGGHTQGPREAFCPDGPTCACRPPPGPADWPLGAWRGPRLSRSTALQGRPGHWASGLRAKTANLTCPEPLLWALVMDTQETPTNTSPLGSTPPPSTADISDHVQGSQQLGCGPGPPRCSRTAA